MEPQSGRYSGEPTFELVAEPVQEAGKGHGLFFRDIGGHSFEPLFEEMWKSHGDPIVSNRLNRKPTGCYLVDNNERHQIEETLANPALRCHSS